MRNAVSSETIFFFILPLMILRHSEHYLTFSAKCLRETELERKRLKKVNPATSQVSPKRVINLSHIFQEI